MSEGLKIQGGLLAKNTALNFIGQVVPLFVALVTIPYIIHHLGTERFLIYKGSLGELKTQLYIAKEIGYLLQDEFQKLNERPEKIAGMLGFYQGNKEK